MSPLMLMKYDTFEINHVLTKSFLHVQSDVIS